jgi:hypothetical protein
LARSSLALFGSLPALLVRLTPEFVDLGAELMLGGDRRTEFAAAGLDVGLEIVTAGAGPA